MGIVLILVVVNHGARASTLALWLKAAFQTHPCACLPKHSGEPAPAIWAGSPQCEIGSRPYCSSCAQDKTCHLAARRGRDGPGPQLPCPTNTAPAESDGGKDESVATIVVDLHRHGRD